MDATCRAFAIETGTTSEQLFKTVTERLELKESSCFALFEKKDDWERCLEPDEKPSDIMKSWPPDQKEENAPKFLFKKKTFIRDDDREMQDPVAKNLLYIQAVYNVINGDYTCNHEQACKLAGLQVHIVYGDHAPVHTVGFLTANLRDYVPKPIFGQKKPADWESVILQEHAKHKGKTADDAKSMYLGIVKRWQYYGTTFYPPCKSINGKKIPNKVIIGVNAEGILLLKPKDKELISMHPFTEICSWASSSTTFAFEFGVQSEATKYTFETKQGAIIASTIQTYIDILVEMLTNGQDDDESTATGTSHGSEGED